MFQRVLGPFFQIAAEVVADFLPEDFTGEFILYGPAGTTRRERFMVAVIERTAVGPDTGRIEGTAEVAEGLQALGGCRICQADGEGRRVNGCTGRLLRRVLDGLHRRIEGRLALHHHGCQIRDLPNKVAEDEVADGVFQHDRKGDGILWHFIDLADHGLHEADEEEHDHQLDAESKDRRDAALTEEVRIADGTERHEDDGDAGEDVEFDLRDKYLQGHDEEREEDEADGDDVH